MSVGTNPLVFPRISGRQGQLIDLDVTLYQAGVPADPYALYKIELYKTQPVPHNLLTTLLVAAPDSDLYPQPIQPELSPGVNGQVGIPIPGRYHLLTAIPGDWQVPDVYFDAWYFYPINPCPGSTDCNLDDPATQRQLLSCCHRFWVFPDEWFCTDALQSIRLGFEPLDQKFRRPEIRPLEVGLMPLPLYDYNYNLITPIIPFLRPTITIATTNCETLLADQPMELALRQGSYRSNPWVARYLLDTDKFLIGTYKYRVTVHLPDGTSRTSDDFILVIR